MESANLARASWGAYVAHDESGNLIKEAESLSAEERKQLLSAVALIDAPKLGAESKDTISDLIANPIKVPGFVPLPRDEANAR